MIEIESVDVTRSGFKVFQNFSWKTESHENWVVKGANGSGKTILLELIAGNIHPSAGEVRYDFIKGTTWEDRFRERKEKIHYIPAHAIQTFLSSYHELFYQQRYYSIGDTEIPLVRNIFGNDLHNLHALSFPASFNIDALLDLELTRLSNGQLKKVLILKNLVKQLPEVVLFDHPFEGLDHTSRLDLIRFIDHISEAYGIQIIMADHHDHLPGVINRTIVMEEGKIKAIENRNHLPQSHPRKEMNGTPLKERNSDPVVEMKNVTIQYGRREILKNINWTVQRGDRWALSGRNGSGKTTLFSLIYADHPMAYSQQVYLFGKRRGSGESIWDIKNRINYLGPELISYLNPARTPGTAHEYITAQHKKNITAELQELIRFFNVESFIDQPVKYLSSGQLQLMLLINYFLSEKELLLLDEPFQFLDLHQKDRVHEYLRLHLRKDVTLILITHDEEDVERWTERMMKV
jgi:molybdate transport system ATP-binding protein